MKRKSVRWEENLKDQTTPSKPIFTYKCTAFIIKLTVINNCTNNAAISYSSLKLYLQECNELGNNYPALKGKTEELNE